MALCQNLCLNDLSKHYPDYCNDVKLGNVDRIALIFCAEAYEAIKADADNPAVWAPLVHTDQNGTATTYNDVMIIKEIGFNLTSEVTTIDNLKANGITSIKSGTTYTIEIVDPSVGPCENFDFYRSLDGRYAYVMALFNDGRAWLSEMSFAFNTKAPNIEKDAQQFWSITGERLFTKGKDWTCFETLGPVETTYFTGN